VCAVSFANTVEVFLELIHHCLQQPPGPFHQLIQDRRILVFLVAALRSQEKMAAPLVPIRLPLLADESFVAQ
jgi:hypothetical protein